MSGFESCHDTYREEETTKLHTAKLRLFMFSEIQCGACMNHARDQLFVFTQVKRSGLWKTSLICSVVPDYILYYELLLVIIIVKKP